MAYPSADGPPFGRSKYPSINAKALGSIQNGWLFVNPMGKKKTLPRDSAMMLYFFFFRLKISTGSTPKA